MKATHIQPIQKDHSTASFFTDKEIETCLATISSLVDPYIQIYPALFLLLRNHLPWDASVSEALQTSGLVAISSLHPRTLGTASQE